MLMIIQNPYPDEIRYEDYKTWPHLNEKFNNLFDIERYYNKDYTETYLSAQLFFKKDSTYKVFKKELPLPDFCGNLQCYRSVAGHRFHTSVTKVRFFLALPKYEKDQ